MTHSTVDTQPISGCSLYCCHILLQCAPWYRLGAHCTAVILLQCAPWYRLGAHCTAVIYCYSVRPDIGWVPTVLLSYTAIQCAPRYRLGTHCTAVPYTATVCSLIRGWVPTVLLSCELVGSTCPTVINTWRVISLYILKHEKTTLKWTNSTKSLIQDF